MRLIQQGEASEVRNRLEAGADPNEQLYDLSPLNAAVRRNNLRMVRLLLEFGADPNPMDIYDPPIARAALQGRLAIVRALIEAGADPDGFADAPGWPLFYASEGGHLEIVRALLEAGGEPRHLSDVEVAASGGHVEIVEALLAAGTHPEPDRVRQAARFFRSVRSGNIDEVRKMLIEGLDPELTVYENDSWQGVWKGREAEAPAIGGWTPLMAAAEAGQPEIIELLIETGANVNALVFRSDIQVETSPLFAATMTGQTETVDMLLRHGAEPDLGASPLAYATISGHAPIVRLLVQAGADPEGVFITSNAYEAAEETDNTLLIRLLDGDEAEPEVRRAMALNDDAWNIAHVIQEWLTSNDETFFGWHEEFRGDAEAGLQEMSRTLGALFEDQFDTHAEAVLVESGLQFLELTSPNGSYTVAVGDEWVVEGVDPLSRSRVVVKIEDVYDETAVFARTTFDNGPRPTSCTTERGRC